jgi:hypothetical protein
MMIIDDTLFVSPLALASTPVPKPQLMILPSARLSVTPLMPYPPLAEKLQFSTVNGDTLSKFACNPSPTLA